MIRLIKRFTQAAAIPKDSPKITRFWKDVSVASSANGHNILLDTRKLKDPNGKELLINSYPLALLVASEWHTQERVLKPHSLPLTSIISRSDDLQSKEEKKTVIDFLMRYFDTDSICYHQSFPEKLVSLQNEYWLPILEFTRIKFGIVNVTDGICGITQPQETKDVLKEYISNYDELKLAAFEKATVTAKSFMIALALIEREINAEHAAKAARLETLAQIDKWGEVQDAHDVDEEDVKKQLGAAVLAVSLSLS